MEMVSWMKEKELGKEKKEWRMLKRRAENPAYTLDITVTYNIENGKRRERKKNSRQIYDEEIQNEIKTEERAKERKMEYKYTEGKVRDYNSKTLQHACNPFTK